MSDLLDRTLGDGDHRRDAATTARAGGAGPTAHQLENAMLNLAVNARDAMDGRGVLTIATGARDAGASARSATAPPGDYVTIAVTDTGCGMTPRRAGARVRAVLHDQAGRQGHRAWASARSSRFVRQSSGEIAIDTAPGQGTTVTLYLPRDIAGAIAPQPVAAIAQRRARRGRRGLDILVVEDDPRVLAATMGALAELGHRPRRLRRSARGAGGCWPTWPRST